MEELEALVPDLPAIIDPELGDQLRRRRVVVFQPQKRIRAWNLKCAATHAAVASNMRCWPDTCWHDCCHVRHPLRCAGN